MTLEHPFPYGFENFKPPLCPRPLCASHQPGAPFPWQRKGAYLRKCDGRVVQRFRCLTCRRFFSVQTFRVDYRLHKPTLHFALLDAFVSKVTQRQAARTLACTRKTVRHRLLLLARHSKAFHVAVLERVRRKGGLTGEFQLDELETYEHSRRLAPVTMPVLIEQHSYFVVHVEAAALPARGNLRPADLEKKRQREKVSGPRRGGSRQAVDRCFEVLGRCVTPGRRVPVATDRKSSYGPLLARRLSGVCAHARHSSTAERTRLNPLFQINHTLAMMRDGLSRLVRRTWAASKQRQWLAVHAWVWIAYRNYILGVVTRQFTKRSLFEWRIMPRQ
jgi:hypothetical protein